MVRRTRTTTEDLRRLKYLKNARRQKNIRPKFILPCTGKMRGMTCNQGGNNAKNSLPFEAEFPGLAGGIF